jgi:guanidinoacetate N-methyltransferase
LERLVAELADEVDALARIAPSMIRGGNASSMSGRVSDHLAADDIMEDWQQPLIRSMATSLAQNYGNLLEIGFGRGIASTMLQAARPSLHTIIDCNPHVLAACETWRAGYLNRDIRTVSGLWQDTVAGLGKFNGILFHTYPLSTDEFLSNVNQYCIFAEEFFPHAAEHLKLNGRFCYFANERDSLSRRHQRSLLHHLGAFEITQLTGLGFSETSRDAHWLQDIVCITAAKKHPGSENYFFIKSLQ